MYIRKKHAENARIKRPNKKIKNYDTVFSSKYGVYLKLALMWSLFFLIDFLMDFRIEAFWSCWLMCRTVNETYRYQGLIFTLFFIITVLTSDLICFLLIPTKCLFFLGCTYIWIIQLLAMADRSISAFTVGSCVFFVYIEFTFRLRQVSKNLSFTLNICRPFAAHCIGYPIVTMCFQLKNYVSHKFRLRRQAHVRNINQFYYELLERSLPEEMRQYTTTTTSLPPLSTFGAIRSIHEHDRVSVPDSVDNSSTSSITAPSSSATNHNHICKSNINNNSNNKKKYKESSHNKQASHNKSKLQSHDTITCNALNTAVLPAATSLNTTSTTYCNVTSNGSLHNHNLTPTLQSFLNAIPNQYPPVHDDADDDDYDGDMHIDNDIDDHDGGSSNIDSEITLATSTIQDANISILDAHSKSLNKHKSTTHESTIDDSTNNKLESHLRRLKSDLFNARKVDGELRTQLLQIHTNETQIRSELRQMRADLQNTQTKLSQQQERLSRDKQNNQQLERRLQEEKNNKVSLHIKLESEKKLRLEDGEERQKAIQIAVDAAARQADCCDSCRKHRKEMENELVCVKGSCKLLDDQIMLLQHQYKEYSGLYFIVDEHHEMVTHMSGLKDENLHLTEQLRELNRMKQELLTSYHSSQLEIKELDGVLKVRNQQIQELHTKLQSQISDYKLHHQQHQHILQSHLYSSNTNTNSNTTTTINSTGSGIHSISYNNHLQHHMQHSHHQQQHPIAPSTSASTIQSINNNQLHYLPKHQHPSSSSSPASIFTTTYPASSSSPSSSNQ